MLLRQPIIEEFKSEISNSRKMLERVPADKFSWKPHEKSMTLKELSSHVAELAEWVAYTINLDELDFAKYEYKLPEVKDTKELVALLDSCAKKSLDALENATDEQLTKTWTLRNGEHVILESPKRVVISSACINHMIHHRAQLSVYLRLLDVPLPSIYGPTADEK